MNPFKLKALAKKTYNKTNKLPLKISIPMIILVFIPSGLSELRIIGHSLANNIAAGFLIIGLGALALYLLLYLWTFWEVWHVETHGEPKV